MAEWNTGVGAPRAKKSTLLLVCSSQVWLCSVEWNLFGEVSYNKDSDSSILHIPNVNINVSFFSARIIQLIPTNSRMILTSPRGTLLSLWETFTLLHKPSLFLFLFNLWSVFDVITLLVSILPLVYFFNDKTGDKCTLQHLNIHCLSLSLSLLLSRSALQKLYSLSQESGRSAAKYFVNNYPKFFTKDFAEPHIPVRDTHCTINIDLCL